MHTDTLREFALMNGTPEETAYRFARLWGGERAICPAFPAVEWLDCPHLFRIAGCRTVFRVRQDADGLWAVYAVRGYQEVSRAESRTD